MYEHYNHWLPKALHALATTVGNHIFYASTKEATPQWLRVHERVHVEQNKREGFLKFNFRYIAEYLQYRLEGLPHKSAHDKISYEQEAFDAERACRK